MIIPPARRLSITKHKKRMLPSRRQRFDLFDYTSSSLVGPERCYRDCTPLEGLRSLGLPEKVYAIIRREDGKTYDIFASKCTRYDQPCYTFTLEPAHKKRVIRSKTGCPSLYASLQFDTLPRHSARPRAQTMKCTYCRALTPINNALLGVSSWRSPPHGMMHTTTNALMCLDCAKRRCAPGCQCDNPLSVRFDVTSVPE